MHVRHVLLGAVNLSSKPSDLKYDSEENNVEEVKKNYVSVYPHKDYHCSKEKQLKLTHVHNSCHLIYDRCSHNLSLFI